MPTYDYECRKCGHEEERFEAMSANGPKRCPACKAPRSFTRRIGMGAGIIFRGSGFYETDYKSKDAGRKAAGRASESAPAASSSSEAKKEVVAAGAPAGGKASGAPED